MTYSEIVLTEFVQDIEISGHWFKLQINGSWTSDRSVNPSGAGDKYPRLIYPLDLLNSLDFASYVLAKEYGTVFYAYSIKVVKTKWWHKLFGLLLAIVICFATALGGCGLVQVIINFIVAQLVSFVMDKILSLIDSPILRAILQFAFAAFQMMGGDFSKLASLTTENYLSLATTFVSAGKNAMAEIEMKDLAEMRKIEMNAEAGEKIEDNIDEMVALGGVVQKADTSSHSSFVESRSPQAFYNASVENMYNYDQFYDASGALNWRINVVSG